MPKVLSMSLSLPLSLCVAESSPFGSKKRRLESPSVSNGWAERNGRERKRTATEMERQESLLTQKGSIALISMPRHDKRLVNPFRSRYSSNFLSKALSLSLSLCACCVKEGIEVGVKKTPSPSAQPVLFFEVSLSLSLYPPVFSSSCENRVHGGLQFGNLLPV